MEDLRYRYDCQRKWGVKVDAGSGGQDTVPKFCGTRSGYSRTWNLVNGQGKCFTTEFLLPCYLTADYDLWFCPFVSLKRCHWRSVFHWKWWSLAEVSHLSLYDVSVEPLVRSESPIVTVVHLIKNACFYWSIYLPLNEGRLVVLWEDFFLFFPVSPF